MRPLPERKVINHFAESYPSAYQLKFSETKGATHLAYDATEGERYLFPDGKAWTAIGWFIHSSGFRAVLLKPEGDNRVILSFAGTDPKSKADLYTDIAQEFGFVPVQYQIAASLAANFKGKYGNNLILTGHSLGGGLATYASLINKLPATTINPAPLAESTVLKLININQCYSLVTNYITGGKEFISNNGVTYVFLDVPRTLVNLGKLAKGILTGHPLSGFPLLPAPPKLRLVVIGNIIPVAGGNRLESYYTDHLIPETAPKIPLPQLITKEFFAGHPKGGKQPSGIAPPKPPTAVRVPTPTAPGIPTPTGTPTPNTR